MASTGVARYRAAGEAAPRTWFGLGLTGASLVVFLLSTRHGIGVLPDSVAYMRIGSAEHFAPFYSWMLRGLNRLGPDIVTSARWIGGAVMALNTMLVWHLLLAASRSAPAAALGTALIVLSPVYVMTHTVAMTEPLFVFFFCVALLLFTRGLDDGRRRWFALVGGLIGLAMLNRFAAAPLLPALCLSRLLYRSAPLARRLGDCALMILAGALVFGTWVAASEFSGGDSTGREMEFLGNPSFALWMSGVRSLSLMLLPSPAPATIRYALLTVVVVMLAVGGLAYGRRVLRDAAGRSPGAGAIGIACALFLLGYGAFIIVSAHIQATLPLSGRILLPIYVAAVMLATIVAARWDLVPRSARAHMSIIAIAAAIMASHAARTALVTADAFRNGIGYENRAWAASPILRAVDRLPADARIFSNAPDVISYRLGRYADYVPRRFSHLTLRDDPDRPFSAQMAALRGSLRRREAYVVIVDAVDWRFYLASEPQLVDRLSLRRLVATADGRIYR